MRYAAAALIFFVGWSVVFFTGVGEHDAAALAITIGASLTAGLVARTWLVVPLAITVVPLAAIQPCDPTRYECDVNTPVLALLLWAPIAAALLALGAGAAKLVRRGVRD